MSKCGRRCDTRKMKRSFNGDKNKGSVEELAFVCPKCGAKWNQVIDNNQRDAFRRVSWRKVA